MHHVVAFWGMSGAPCCATIGAAAAFIEEGREIAERRRRTSLKSPAAETTGHPAFPHHVTARPLIDRRPP